MRVFPKHRDFTDFPPTRAEGQLDTFMDVHENNVYAASTQVYENALHLAKVPEDVGLEGVLAVVSPV